MDNDVPRADHRHCLVAGRCPYAPQLEHQGIETTIDLLVAKNKELYDEIMTLRKENDALRDEGIKRDNEIAALRLQIEQLRK